MAKLTGKDLAFTIGGTAIGVARTWSLDHNGVDVETTAAGDAVVDRAALRTDYTVDFTALLEIANPYVFPSTLVGSSIAWAGKLVASDANGLVGSTGLGRNLRINVPYDDVVEITGQIVAKGTALTWDLSPAT